MLRVSHQSFLTDYAVPGQHFDFEHAPLATLRATANPSEEIIDKAVKHPDWRVRFRLSRKDIAPEHLDKLKDDEDHDVVESVCKNEKASPETLEHCSHHINWNVRAAVAQNPSTPAHVISKLADDHEGMVARGAALNTNAPKDVLIKSVKSNRFSIVDAALHNRNADADVYRAGLEHPDLHVQSMSRDFLDHANEKHE